MAKFTITFKGRDVEDKEIEAIAFKQEGNLVVFTGENVKQIYAIDLAFVLSIERIAD